MISIQGFPGPRRIACVIGELNRIDKINFDSERLKWENCTLVSNVTVWKLFISDMLKSSIQPTITRAQYVIG